MGRGNAASLVVLALGLAALAAGCGGDDEGTQVEVTGDIPTEGSFLFVVRGDSQAENGRLSVDSETVEWFTDRPERLAGISEIDQLADRWSDFGLANSPPNASVVGGETEAVVELDDPRLDGGSISFAYEPLEGQTLEEGELGGVSVFVDDSTGGGGSIVITGVSDDSGCGNFTVSAGGETWKFNIETASGPSGPYVTTNKIPACADMKEVVEESFTGTGFTAPDGEIADTTWSCSWQSGSTSKYVCKASSGTYESAYFTGTGSEESS